MAQALQLVIGNKTYSSWSLRPWLLLKHYQVAFDEIQLWFQDPEFKSRVRALTPNARVPALLHQDSVIWDSLAICEYVNEAFLQGRGWPQDLIHRAHARSVVAEMHSGFASLRGELPMNIRRTPCAKSELTADTQADIRRISTLWRELLGRFNGEFLFGDFTIADSFFAPVVTRFHHYGIDLSGREKDYAQRMLALPAMRQWYAEAGTEELDPGHD